MSNIFVTDIIGSGTYAVPASDAQLAAATAGLDALLSGVTGLSYDRVLAWVEDAAGPDGAEGPGRTLNCLLEKFTYNGEECPDETEVDTVAAAIEAALEADANITSVDQQQYHLFQAGAFFLWQRDAAGGFLYPNITTDDVAVGGFVSPTGKWFDDGDLVLGGNVMSGTERLRVIGDARVEGKLTVTGLIDPTGLVLTEQATVPGGAPAAGYGTFWVRNDTPNVPMFTDDGGTDHVLSSPWTQAAGYIYLTTTTDSVVIGDTVLTGSEKLKVDGGNILLEGGNLVIPASANNGSVGVMYIGATRMLYRPVTNNIYVGNAGNFTALGATQDSIGIGDGALAGISGAGHRNIAIGSSAGAVLNSAENVLIGHQVAMVLNQVNNVVIGCQAMLAATSATNNVVIGHQAWRVGAGAGNQNVIIGEGAVEGAAYTGHQNVFIGAQSGENATGANSNAGVGYRTLGYLTSGGYNAALGRSSGLGHTTGTNNVSVGYLSMGGSEFGSEGAATDNTAAGALSLQYWDASSNRNAAFGASALGDIDGSGAVTNTTGIGYRAGGTAAGASNCLYLGAYAGYSNTTSNRLFVHASAADVGVNALIYGEFDNGLVRINDTLDVFDQDETSSHVGVTSRLTKDANSNKPAWTGFEAFVNHTVTAGTGTAGTYIGFQSDTDLASTAAVTITNARGFNSQLSVGANVTLSDYRGIYIESPVVGGTLTLAYGIYVANQGGGAGSRGLYVDDDAEITGKLTVGGLIDPTGLVLDDQATVPGGSPGAGKGTVWVRSDSPTTLMFTDSGGTDYAIGGAVGGSPWTTTATVIHPVTLTNQVGVGKTTGAGLSELMFVIDDEETGSGSTLVVELEKNSTGTRPTWVGLHALAAHTGTGSGTDYRGVLSEISNTAAATITSAYCFYASARVTNASGETTNLYAYYIPPLTPTGTLDNSYGLYISSMGGASDSYGIYQVDSDDRNFLNGLVGIGVQPAGGSVGRLQVRDTNDTSTTYGADINLFKGAGAKAAWAGLRIQQDVGTGSVADSRGIWIRQPTNGTITTAYGLYIDQQYLSSTTSYGVYQASSSDVNYFAGIVGVGTTLLQDAMVDVQDDYQTTPTWGVRARLNKDGGGTKSVWRGFEAQADYTSDEDAGTCVGFDADINYGAGTTSTMTAAYGFRAQLEVTDGTSTCTDWYGLRVQSILGGGTTTNAYGVYIDDQGGSVNNYAVYQAGGANKNYFAGIVGVGIIPAGEILAVRDERQTGSVQTVQVDIKKGGASTMSDWTGVQLEADVDNASGVITDARYINIASPAGSGSYTQVYGLYINDLESASAPTVGTAYGVYQAGSLVLNHFGGTMGVGTVNSGVSDALLVYFNKDALAAPFTANVVTARFNKQNAGTVDDGRCFTASAVCAAGTIADLRGVLVNSPTGAGAVTDIYGLYVATQKSGPAAAATNAYGVYQGGQADLNYFSGRTGFGTSSISANAQVEIEPDHATIGSQVRGLYIDLNVSSGTLSSLAACVDVDIDYTSTSGPSSYTSFRSNFAHSPGAAATLTSGYGYYAEFQTGASGTISSAYHFYAGTPGVSLGAIMTSYGFYCADLDTGGSTGVAYGLYIASQTPGTLGYGIWQDGTNNFNILRGPTGIGGSTVNGSAILDLQSTTGALIVPRMTTAQRTALGATNGMIVYDTTASAFYFYENGAWVTGSGLA